MTQFNFPATKSDASVGFEAQIWKNSIKKSILSLVAASLLAGCEVVGLGAVVVTAPVWVPIEYGVRQSRIRQPVEIVDTQGKSLAPVFDKEREALLVVQKDAVICTGVFPLSEANIATRIDFDPLDLKCNKALKGRLFFSGLTTSSAIVKVGPASAPQKNKNQLSEVSQRCLGSFNRKKGVVGSFLLECDDGRFGAISPKSAEPGTKEFTVWLPPPL